MSQKPETKFRAKVQRDLDTLKNCWNESIQQKAIHGTPDKILCINGWLVGLELKADERSPITKLQDHKLKQIAKAGGWGLVTHPQNWEETFKFLQYLDNMKREEVKYG